MEKARETAENRYWVRWHVVIYLIVNTGLFGLWFYAGPTGFLWPLIPLFFWGLGLVAHYITAYRSIGRGWVDKETRKIMQEEKERDKETPKVVREEKKREQEITA